MDNLQERYRMAKLIAKQLTGTIILEEERELRTWAEGHGEEYKYVQDGIREELDQVGTINVIGEWEVFASRSGLRKRIIRKMWYYVAAVFAGVCMVTGGLVMRENPEPKKLAVTDIRQQVKNFKATLILEDGREVMIQDSARKVITTTKGTEVVSLGNELRYGKKDSVERKEIVYNTLRIPRGGEYKLVLADGTTVWLNSESSLKYPVHFAGEQREVWMEGEVCFDVAKNEKQPFVVHANKAEVTVLGTLFNVEAYSDEKTVTTTLVHGKVQVVQGSESYVMEPDEQVVIDEGRFTVKKVVAEDFVRWTSGVFSFTGTSLETIMDKLARWYDVEVFFQDSSLKDLHITLEVRRYDNIADILTKMEKMGLIQFDISNRTIIVHR